MIKKNDFNKRKDEEKLLTNAELCELLEQNLKIRILKNSEGKIIKFYEMSHVAPQEFYDRRNKLLLKDIADGFVVHHEGLRNVPEKFSKDFDYEKIAQVVGLVSQQKPLYDFKNFDADWNNLSFKEHIILGNFVKFSAKVMSILIQIIAENPEEINVLRKGIVGVIDDNTSVENSEGFFKKFNSLNKIIVDKRNKILVDAALAEKSSVSLVWGSAHFAGCLKLFEKAGFVLID